MADIVTGTECCGISELDGVYKGKPEEIIEDMYEQYGERFNGRYLIFSDRRRRNGYTRLTRLARYIRENNLGRLTTLPPQVNPNSGNTLKVYLWAINLKTLSSWGKKRGLKRICEMDSYNVW